jgi:hypothetical protein
MKQWTAVVLSVVILLVIAVAWQQSDTLDPSSEPQQQAAEASAQAVLGVDQLIQNVNEYHGGIITVEGVVSAVSDEQQMLGLIDTREFAKCQITSCSRLTLPIRWTGAMPLKEETIQVKGAVQAVGKSFVFVAEMISRQQ